jgi:hypothetical protein
MQQKIKSYKNGSAGALPGRAEAPLIAAISAAHLTGEAGQAILGNEKALKK